MTYYAKEVLKTIQIKKHPKDSFNLPSLENDAIFLKAAKSNINGWTVKDMHLGRTVKLYRRINTLQTIASRNNSQ
ncbi:(S)-tetrahydroprotoberberine N-methyltransferase [Trichinella spiralis]|uniref:(S)-tetrahydroprotoberberine N-methyltransferase n=1 Tax=Trichinella spiralis TaxID=6334 RepID=A0ABR3KML7_TRISP